MNKIAKYYEDKIEKYGLTSQGVDWNSTESQEKRFDVLLKVLQDDKSFSLNDLGCGYGALYHYIRNKGLSMTE